MAPKILIVDDMPDAIKFLPDWFKNEGYDTVIASRGQEALALAEEMRPDIILLDTVMPQMDGIETCRRLHMNPATSHIPVILMSSRTPSEAQAESVRAGAADYITRPIQFPDLLSRVQRLVRMTQDPPVDHSRLLEEMTYTALAVLPCQLAWLLTIDADNRWLEHQALAFEHTSEAQRFLSLARGTQETVRFPLEHGDNPFAEVALNRRILINFPTRQITDLTGGRVIQPVLAQFDFMYISLLPLVTNERVVGVLMLATTDTQLPQSRRTQQILSSLSNQAAMAVDNARLLADISAREAQMRAEQTFRQMVLDTMGEGLIVVDGTATITYVNNRLLRMTGYTREMLYGQSVGTVFHPDSRKELIASFQTSDRPKTFSFKQQLLTRGGKVMPVLLSRAIAPSPIGDDQSTVMVVTDLSELQANEQALRVQTERLQALNQAGNAISSASSFDEVARVSLEATQNVVQGESVVLLMRDPNDLNMLTTVLALGPCVEQARTRQVTLGQGIAGTVAETGQSQCVPDLENHAAAQEEYAAAYQTEFRSVMAVPLIAFDEVVGVVEVLNKTSGAFDDQDLAIVESLAVSAAITIENTRLFDQTRRRVTELSTLLDASAAVTSTLDFGDVLERIARRLSLALHVQRVVIATWHRPSNRLVTLSEVANAYWSPEQGPIRRPDNLPLTYRAVKSKHAITPHHTPQNAEQPISERNPSGLHGVGSFPLQLQGQVVGAVALYSESPQTGITADQADTVIEVVTAWQNVIESYDPTDWISRPNLTDLGQRLSQASRARWATILLWDETRHEFRVLREIGYALWVERSNQIWAVDRHPTLGHVLETGNPVIVHTAEMADDPVEQTYLQNVGGTSCLIAPLFIRGEAGGLVKLIDTEHEQREFDNAEISLCQAIANVVGNAMENAQLYTAQEQRASALEAAYKELQEADQMKDDLLQNLSHELRTPLTHILGYLRLLLDRAFGDLAPEQQQTLELVASKAEHLAELVQDIVSVQESEAHNLMPKPIHLDRVVALAVRAVAVKAKAQGIRIIPHIPANLPLVYADPVRLGEVFEELLENAIKFSPSAAQIEISVDDPGGLMLRVSVRDYGIGIAPEDQEKIFRRFYQVESGTTRRFGGTGLGLTIVQQVIEGHNGRVWVESVPGEGACFHLTLPKATTIVDSE